jgi:hypothetical protein
MVLPNSDFKNNFADRNMFTVVVFLLLGDSPASEFYTPTFRNTLFHLHRSREQHSRQDESLKSTLFIDVVLASANSGSTLRQRKFSK